MFLSICAAPAFEGAERLRATVAPDPADVERRHRRILGSVEDHDEIVPPHGPVDRFDGIPKVCARSRNTVSFSNT